MKGQALPRDLAVYKKRDGARSLRSETILRKKEEDASELFKKGRLVEAIRVMEDLIDYSSEMGGFDELASRKLMMEHI